MSLATMPSNDTMMTTVATATFTEAERERLIEEARRDDEEAWQAYCARQEQERARRDPRRDLSVDYETIIGLLERMGYAVRVRVVSDGTLRRMWQAGHRGRTPTWQPAPAAGRHRLAACAHQGLRDGCIHLFLARSMAEGGAPGDRELLGLAIFELTELLYGVLGGLHVVLPAKQACSYAIARGVRDGLPYEGIRTVCQR